MLMKYTKKTQWKKYVAVKEQMILLPDKTL